jgi:hypothetical protein
MRFIDWLKRREGAVTREVIKGRSGLHAALRGEVPVRGEGEPYLPVPLVRGEGFKTYTSMRLFTSPSGRVLRQHQLRGVYGRRDVHRPRPTRRIGGSHGYHF